MEAWPIIRGRTELQQETKNTLMYLGQGFQRQPCPILALLIYCIFVMLKQITPYISKRKRDDFT